MWGSDQDLAIKLGSKFAISYNELRLNEMNECFLNYVKKGFNLNLLKV